MSKRNEPDNRPTKDQRSLKKGDQGKDGLRFWQYSKGYYDNGEWWVTADRFDELILITRQIKNKYKKSEKGKAAQRRYESKKRSSCAAFKLKKALRDRVYAAIKAQVGEKSKRTLELLGCSVEEARDHIEVQFTDGMTWENHGEWHVDHILPCASFDLTKPKSQEMCFHYSNLQPLWAQQNRAKSDKLNYE